MNKETMHFPIAGTAALQAKQAPQGIPYNIIAFPGALKNETIAEVAPQPVDYNCASAIQQRFAGTRFVQQLRCGSVQGIPFEKIEKWQAACAGMSCFIAAAATILIGA